MAHVYKNEIHHEGRIEFGGIFRNATSARIAALKSLLNPSVDFVKMKIDGRDYRTIRRDDPADETREISDPMTIAELVEVYAQTEADIREGFAQVSRAMAALDGAVALGGTGMSLRSSYDRHCGVNWDKPDEPLRELRRSVWRALIERSQIRKAMSVEAWKKLDEELTRGEPLDITIENVEGVIENFRAEAPEMLRAAVKEVFEMLRPHTGGAWRETFKTNSEFEIGERVILSGFVQVGWGSKWDVNSYRSQDLIALENVFNAVDGKIRETSDGYYSKLQAAIEALPLSGPCAGETDLFEFRGHRKGTLHLRFKRLDLVERLNAIAGGKTIKPVGAPAAKVRRAAS